MSDGSSLSCYLEYTGNGIFHRSREYTTWPYMYAWKEGSLLADTEFKIFAKRLSTKYRRNRKVEAFAKELFEKIYLPESEDDPVDETLPRTYKAYY